MADPITAHIDAAYAHHSRPARWTQTRRRWTDARPLLAVDHPDELIDRLHDFNHPLHTATALELIRAQQSQEPAASAVLLFGLQRLIAILACRSSWTTRRDQLWTALGQQLTTINPDTFPVTPPFAIVALGRLRRSATRMATHAAPSRSCLLLDSLDALPTATVDSIEDTVIVRQEFDDLVRRIIHEPDIHDTWTALSKALARPRPHTISDRVHIHRLRRHLRSELDLAPVT